MAALVQVANGQNSDASHVNQYADLSKGDYIYDVVNGYGAIGDGVTDDQAAIQAAIDAAGVAGGGMVWFPKGRYLLTALAIVTGGAEAHLSIPYNNVTLAGSGAGSVIMSADNYQMIHSGLVGPSNGYAVQTVYNLTSSYILGVQSITLLTAGQAANFAAGDYIYIRTGQTLDGGTTNPDAEVNQVRSVNPGTGVITLAWPTAKPYAQEYFITGTTGRTSTTVTANLAAYGVSKVTDQTVHDQIYRDLRFETTGTGGQAVALYGGQAVRVMVDNCSGSFNNGFMVFGAHRFMTVRYCTFDHPGAQAAYYYTLTTDTACSDTLWIGNTITSEHVTQFHVHEGSSRVRIIGNMLSGASTGSDYNYISIRARAYDISVIGNTFVGSTPATLYVDSDCSGGGLITGNQFLGATGFGVNVGARNWMVTDNRYPNGTKQYLEPLQGADTDVRYLSAWVTPTNTTARMGSLPANVYVRQVRLYVKEVFNSSGTDTITVGISGATNAYATSQDVSALGDFAAPAGAYLGYQDGSNPPVISAYYTAGGSAPSQGKVLAVLEYAPVTQSP